MQIGIGLDARLGLSVDETSQLTKEAVALGYTSAWTPASATGLDSFHVCSRWHHASGISTGISVVPSPVWSVPTLAAQAGTVGDLTGGTFVLGIGPGALHDPGFRASYGLGDQGPLGVMREQLVTLRALLAGEKVTHEGQSVTLRGVQLGWRPPKVPVYVAALGPRMLRLAGEVSDGVLPNWNSPEQIAWARERVAEGARKAGRDPATIPFVQYIRVCVDEDVAAARRAFGKQVLMYALMGTRELGYRAHFGRMGFEEVLTDLEARRGRGTGEDELVDAIPDELLRKVGFFGPPKEAGAAFRELARGLDTAVVRVITARPGMDAVRVAMEACKP